MGRNIVKHPTKPGFMIWSTIVDDWLWKDPITIEKYIAFRRNEVGDSVEKDIWEILSKLEVGKPGYPEPWDTTFKECEEIRAAKVARGEEVT